MPWPRRPSHLSRRALAVTGVLAVAAPLGAEGLASGAGTSPGKSRSAANSAAKKKRSRSSFICKVAGKGKKKKGRVVCVTGPAGPIGPAGPPGSAGPAAPQTSEVIIPRTVIPFTTNFMTDGGNVQNLAKVGPIHVDGLCRRTFSPGKGGGGRMPTHPDPRLPTSGGESEAQILVWSETGSVSFKGAHGPRINIPPGPPDFTLETGASAPAGGKFGPRGTDHPVADPVAGEGDHLFVAASNENVDEDRATDPASDNPSADIASGKVVGLSEYPGFDYASGPVTTNQGHILLARVFAGFDVLGVYGECVFGGVVRSIA